MRRSEIGRAQWPHVFWDADEIMVAASKSDPGEGRRAPMVGPLKKILREEWMRQGRPPAGRIVIRSVLSGKWQGRTDKAGRYIKNLPVPRGTTARAKLEACLAAEIGDL